MTLDQHPEFRDLIGITAAELKIVPELVEKDYWVTRVLRALAGDRALKTQLVFKGGTSLSKGWKLIDRFSEDIDLLTTGPDFSQPPAGKAAKAAVFQQILNCVERETGLKRPIMDGLDEEERNFLYLKGKSNCNVRLPLPGRVISSGSDSADYVFLEMGFRGSPNPREVVALNSLVGEAILSGNAGDASLLADYEGDFSPFKFVLLHPSRTFVEKLLALHTSILKDVEEVRTRHYYDIYSLLTRHPDIPAFLEGSDFRKLVGEAIEIGNQNFGTKLDPNLNLAESPALKLSTEQIEILKRQYREEARYYFRGQPRFERIVESLADIRDRLTRQYST